MNNGYEKLAMDIFGEKAVKGVCDVDSFAKAIDAALETIEPEQKAAVMAVYFDGQEADAVYHKAMRNLKHPSRSNALKEFLEMV